MKKLFVIILLIIASNLNAQTSATIDTIPMYQIMIGSHSLDSIRVIDDTIFYKLTRQGQIMDKWDDIHQDSISKINYINTPPINRIINLYELDSLGESLFILSNVWDNYKLGLDSLSSVYSALSYVKFRANTVKDISENIKDIILKTDIINSKRTKIIFTPNYKSKKNY